MGSKGSRYERKLVNLLQDEGWAVMRAGGSGSGTAGDRPDVLAGDGNRRWAFEAKFFSGRNIYVDPQEVDQIVAFAEGFSGDALLLPRWNTGKVDACDVADWFVVPVYRCPRSSGGKYALRVEEIMDRFPRLADVL